MSLVLCLRKSRTATVPRETLVSVPSQRSVTVQIVPRTVADEYRPRVRKRPLPLPLSRRILRLLRAILDFLLFFFLADPQRLKLEPFRRSSNTPFALFLPDCTV